MSARSSRRRGRSTGPTLTTIWWRDIPVQVSAHDDRDGTQPVRAELPARFVHAMDRAAMEADLTGADTYLDQLQRRTRPCGADLAAEVAAEVERLVAAHPREVLAALVANAANTPDTDVDGATPTHVGAPDPSPGRGGRDHAPPGDPKGIP